MEPRRYTVRQALALLLVAILLPMLVGTALVLAMQWRAERRSADNQLLTLATTLLQAVDGELARAQTRLQAAAASELLERRDWPAFHRYASRIVQDWPGTLVGVAGPDGQLLVNTALPLGTPLPNLWQLEERQQETVWQGRSLPVSSQGMTRRVFETGQPQFSNLYFGVGIQRPTLATALPVPGDGPGAAAAARPALALILAFPPARLQQLIGEVTEPKGLRALVVDRNNVTVAYSSAATPRLAEPAPPVRGPTDPPTGMFELQTRDGMALVGAYAVSPLNGFTVRVSTPREQAYASAMRTSLLWAGLWLAVAALGAGTAAALAGQLTRGFKRLAAVAEQRASPAGSGPEDSHLLEVHTVGAELRKAREVQDRHAQEVLDRRVAQERGAAAEASERQLRRVVDSLFVFVGLLDAEGRVIEVNQAPLVRTGLRREDVLGRPFWECGWWRHSADVAAQVRRDVARAAAGETVRYDVTVQAADGDIITIDFQINPVRDDAGRVMHLVPCGVDITARVQAVQALTDSEARAHVAAADAEAERRLLDATLQAVPAGIAVADAGGRLLRSNHGMRLIWGDIPPERRADPCSWRAWWADGSARQGRLLTHDECTLARALQGQAVAGDIVEIEPFGQPGVRRVIFMSAAPVCDAAGAVVGAVLAQVDISNRVIAEAALRESESRLRALADNIPQLAWIASAEGQLVWWNRRVLEFAGDQCPLESRQQWAERIHPDHLSRVAERAALHLASGQPWEDTFALRRRDGSYRWFLSRAVRISDSSGLVPRWFGTSTDISEQRSVESALRQSQDKLLAREGALHAADRQKDEFLATLAHELRNPLAPIRTSAEIIRKRQPDDAAVARAAEIILRQAMHLTRLVDDLLEVSHITFGTVAMQMAPIDLRQVVGAALELAGPAVEAAGHRLKVRTPPLPLRMQGDATRLTQVVANLLGNACKFTPPPGDIELAVEAAEGWATVRVRDSGRGIAPHMKELIFELFVQERRSGHDGNTGLGVGLALARRLVQMHGGRIWAHSDGEGRGSEFFVRLPLREMPPQAPPAVPAAAQPSAPPARTLVVDDNVDAALSLAELLRMEGHSVQVAHDGAQALALVDGWQPDAAIIDIGLPDMTGHEVARRIRQRSKGRAPLLVALTGWAAAVDPAGDAAAAFDHHLTKPADPAQVLALLAQRPPVRS